MRLVDINKSCFDVINYFNNKYRYKDLYEKKYSMFDKIDKENLFKKLNMIIDSKVISELKNDYYKYYYIYLYCVLFKEQLITSEDIEGIVNNVYNADYYSLLLSNKKLSNKTVSKILDLLKDNNYVYLGKIPFDYRYHIIKRNEISDDIKNKVVDSYSKEELKKINKELKDIILFEELYYSEIDSKDNMFNDKNISDEYRVYQRLNNKAS